MSYADYSTTEEINQALCGQAWHIETIGPERSETDTRWTHITTAWSVFVHPFLVHTYEVCQWSYARVYKTHTIRLCSDGRFTCTCPTGQNGFATSVRGYCNHINRLVIHHLRRDPTLPVPARQLRALPLAKTGAVARTQGRNRPTSGKEWPATPPRAAAAGRRRALSPTAPVTPERRTLENSRAHRRAARRSPLQW